MSRKDGVFSIENAWTNTNQINSLTLLPGFDNHGQSLLSKAFANIKKPGHFIKSIALLNRRLQNIESQDIDWNTWLEEHFVDSNFSNVNTQAITSLKELKILINNANEHDPILGDALMISQIVDCSVLLNIDLI